MFGRDPDPGACPMWMNSRSTAPVAAIVAATLLLLTATLAAVLLAGAPTPP